MEVFFLGGAFWNRERRVFDDECGFDVVKIVSFFISFEEECVLCYKYVFLFTLWQAQKEGMQ